MKKVFALVAIASMAMFVACGPSAEEIKKAKEDSLAKVQKEADSLQKIADEAAALLATPDTTVPAEETPAQ